MSLRSEQCKKVCRILDDVLANRPTERDSLIVAVQKAFEVLETAGIEWIPCSERLPEPNEVVLISVNGNVDADWIAVDNTGYGCWYRTMKYAIDIDAWMPLPEPWKGEEE